MKKIILLVATLLVSVALLWPMGVHAENLFEDACKEPGTGKSAACSTPKSKGNPIVDTINDATSLLTVVAGIAAGVLLVIAGFMYVSSEGDSSKIESAKKTVIYTVVGLIIILLARAIISFVILNVYE